MKGGNPPWFLLTVLLICCITLIDIGQCITVEVPEDAKVGYDVYTMPLPSNGEMYSIFKEPSVEPALKLFELSPAGLVKVKKNLNRQELPTKQFSLVILLRKAGQTSGGKATPLVIQITDVNDHTPIFSSNNYQGHVVENQQASTVVDGLIDAYAIDNDTAIASYQIIRGDPENRFAASINNVHGIAFIKITTTEPLNREEQSAYRLTIRADDTGKPSRSSTATVDIIVIDINDMRPSFTSQNYTFRIDENVPVMSSIGTVTAYDTDNDMNGEIYYYPETPMTDFMIDYRNGAITVLNALNYHKKNLYSFKINAKDRGQPSLKAIATHVTIRVNDVDNYSPTISTSSNISYQAPKFTHSNYYANIYADFPPNSIVLVTHAFDSDAGTINNRLTYSAVGGNSGLGVWAVDSQTGAVRLAGELQPRRYTFQVQAKDKLKTKRASIATVTISVYALDNNQNAPSFTQPIYSAVVKEDVPIDTSITRVAARDQDNGINGRITYSIQAATSIGYFSIESQTGIVRTSRRLNYDLISKYWLTISAEDQATNNRRSSSRLIIQVVDVDDHTPIFEKVTYQASLPESASPGSFVTVVRALDQDSPPNAKITYSIDPSTNTNPPTFKIDKTNGIISTLRSLDRETNDYYEIRIVTSAETSTILSIQITDVNDNVPKFTSSSYGITVPENMGNNPNFLCMHAVDYDKGNNGLVSYSIISGNTGNKFHINEKTGLVSVKNLNYEEQSSYLLTVRAMDNGSPRRSTTVTANVQVLDKTDPPRFEANMYQTVLPDDVGTGQVVITVKAISEQEQRLQYSMINADPLTDSTFMVDAKSAQVIVKSNDELDYRKRRVYQFQLQVEDTVSKLQATTTIKVEISDANNNYPTFSQSPYWITIHSDIPIGKQIMQIKAIDNDGGSDGKVIYSFATQQPRKDLSINANNGIISTTSKIAKTGKSPLSFSVTAKDGGAVPKTSSTLVLITVVGPNQKLVEFNRTLYQIAVGEDMEPKNNFFNDIRAVNPKGTSEGVSYEIVGGNFDNTFKINSRTAAISLTKPLNYEDRYRYDLVIRAKYMPDSSQPTNIMTANIDFYVDVLDRNDAAPQFLGANPVQVSIEQDWPSGTFVTQVLAYDNDIGTNGIVRYSLEDHKDKFAVNATTGIITTAAILNAANTPNDGYFLNVVASDSGIPPRSSKRLVKVQVSTEYSLKFSSSIYTSILPENAKVGHLVTEFDVVSEKQTPKFSFMSGNGTGKFCIDQRMRVTLQNVVDFDREDDKYTLTLQGENGLSKSTATLNVNVRDLNDNPPVFTKSLYNAEVGEDAPVGTTIIQVNATDIDHGANGQLTYSIDSFGNRQSSDCFAIDPKTAIIRTRRSLDYEEQTDHVITVRAVDGGNPARQSLARVNVAVDDRNDNAPKFLPKTPKTKFVYVTVPVGHVVVQLVATDPDDGENGKITYSLAEDASNEGRFGIDPRTGDVTVVKPLDGIDVQYELTFRATDGGANPKFSEHPLFISIRFPPKTPPYFVQPNFVGYVRENMLPNTQVVQAKALSADTILYKIESADVPDVFAINGGNGWITTTKMLDYEKENSFQLIVRATDISGRDSDVKVKILVTDENEFTPLFSHIEYGELPSEVSIDLSVGSNIMQLEAKDYDNATENQITYQIDAESAKEHFAINSKSGLITNLRSLRGLISPYRFQVSAIDNGKPPKKSQATACVIIINRPSNQQSVNVDVIENAAVGSNVVQLSTTISNPYYIIAFPNITQFKIYARSGLIVVGSSIDREVNMRYKLIAQVSPSTSLIDFTTIIVNINIIDHNDNKPVFVMSKPYEATVNENALVGTSVYQLKAVDADFGKNSEIEYLLDSSSSGPFSINPVTGIITTTGAKLDLGQVISLIVRAADKGNPQQISSDAIITIRVKNRSPEFSQPKYQVSIHESPRRNLPVVTVKAKSFSGRGIVYSIVSGTSNSRLVISADTGLITAPFGLDYESDPHDYNLVVRATESEANPLTSQVQVLITLEDYNDCAPAFTQTEYKPENDIPESVAVGTQVLKVSASDCDTGSSGQLRYSIVKSDHFKIDEVSGAIEVSKRLNYEATKVYSFMVGVHDLGTPSRSDQARVIIPVADTNDEPPIFSASVYKFKVDENAPGGETVATVVAFDPDSKSITYSIVGGNSEENFIIDSISGVIRLRRSPEPNFRSRSYTLRVSASDTKLAGYADVIIDVNDVNDHKPIFTHCNAYAPTVNENQPAGTSVITVTAIDEDEGSFGLVSYSLVQDDNEQQYFVISPKTGLITTTREFDREKQSLYSITVRATDGGSNSSASEVMSGFCTFNVKITDINDNAPGFEFKQYFGSVPLDSRINTEIITLVASDNDTGSNGVIAYSLDSGKDAFFFQIGPTDGILRTARTLDSSKKEYRFLAYASDRGQPPLQSSAPVVVQVQDNNAARFSKSRYIANIAESASVRTLVTTVNAYMAGDASNSWTATYALEPGNLPKTNNPQKFGIDVASGEIRVIDSLDYEVTTNFELKVTATLNNGNQILTTVTTVIINILDVNDNPPRFTHSLYAQYIRENSPVGTPLEGNHIKASDRDTNSSTAIAYSILDNLRPTSRGKFIIDSQTGQLRTAVVFDRETSLRFYTIIVKATDNGKPSQASTASVRVQILDVNDSPPRFARPVYTAKVAENVEIGFLVTTVTATDADTSENTKLTYFFVKGNQDGRFAVDSNGRITVQKTLDFENKPKYSLTLQAFDGRFNGTTKVNITVTDVNDNRPRFVQFSYTTRIREDAPIGTTLFSIYAVDPDKTTGNVITYSLSGQGISDVDPPLFIVEQTGMVKINALLDREKKQFYEFSCIATDNGKPQLSGFADCRVYLDDANDERPYFPDKPYVGYVLENVPPPVNVRPVTALDNDIGNNSRFIYSLVNDAQKTFGINKDNGMITTRKELDREKQSNYTVIVRATDLGSPPLSGQVNVVIRVSDANDHPPLFSKKLFTANVSENAPLGFPVVKLMAYDNDIGSNGALLYSITGGNKPVHFAIEADTGWISVSENQLNYENSKVYNLTVAVQDRGTPTLKDVAQVIIYVGDYNDIPPQFNNPSSHNISISEAARIGSFVTQVIATDPESGQNGNIYYSIAAGDPDKSFTVDKLTGVVTVHKPLDRESPVIPHHFYTLILRATDYGQPPLYNEIPVYVYLDDINDNGPIFIPPVYHGKIMENRKATQNVTQLRAMDPDSAKNGAPFTFSIVQTNNFTKYFTLDSRTGVIQTVDMLFDREQKSQYVLTVKATDSGIPLKSATTNVYVTVADENDNQHKSGTVTVDVIGYNGKFNGGNIGYVHSPDPDDDRTQKTYTIISGNEERWFSINRTNGLIYCRPGLPMDKEFRMKVRVSDGKFADVTSTVVVDSQSRSTDALLHMASLQAQGISANDFVLYYSDRFRNAVASLMSNSKRETTVTDILSVQSAIGNKPGVEAVDVMFAVHNNLYYSKDVIESRLIMHKASLEQDTGLLINQIGIEACKMNICPSGCTTDISTNNSINFVSASDRSFTGVKVAIKPECYHCSRIPKQKVCQANSQNPCLNDGICTQHQEGANCQCKPGFSAPYCQWTTRSFESNSYFWLQPLPKCTQLVIELDFTTTNSDGLLLYAGPVSGSNGDYLAIELIRGRIEITFSVATTGTIVAAGTLIVADGNLNDGNWHNIQYQYDGKTASAMVDGCISAPVNNINGTIEQDRSRCFTKTIFPVAASYMSGNSPVQLGGLYIDASIIQNRNLRVASYQGCIRNFKVNGELQDLGNPLRQLRTSKYCSPNTKCTNSCNRNGRCIHSWSKSYCECNLGYDGQHCEKETMPVRFPNNTRGYIRYDMSKIWNVGYSKYEFKIITRDCIDCMLLFVDTGTAAGLEMIQMQRGKIRYTVKLPESQEAQSISVNLTCNGGTWCSIVAERKQNIAMLKVNNIANYMQLRTANNDQLMIISGSERFQMYFGGIPNSKSFQINITRNFMGCANDLRYNDQTILINGSKNNVLEDIVGSVHLGCKSIGCTRPPICPADLYCDDLWDAHRCIDICKVRNPCQHNGSCSISNSLYQCACSNGYFGSQCAYGGPATQMRNIITYSGAAGGALLVLLLCIAVFLIIQSRNKRKIKKRLQFAKQGNATIAPYHIEGGGEDDINNFDITILKNPLPDSISSLPLKIPLSPTNSSKKSYSLSLRQSLNFNPYMRNSMINPLPRNVDPDELMKNYIWEDSTKCYADEGSSTPAASLSSLEIVEDDDEEIDGESPFGYLNIWGPRFKQLADIYHVPSKEDIDNS